MHMLPKMFEATRLTRAGKLKEAMEILRGVRPAAPQSPAASAFASDARRTPDRDMPHSVDLDPPSAENRGTWTAPPFADSRAPDQPAGIRNLLDHMGRLRFARGHDGLAEPEARRNPAPLPNGARFDEHGYANTAGARAYKLYVPSRYNGQAWPLVVMLHGCTQSPDDFAAGTRMNEMAEAQNFLVAYPAQLKSANASKCWNWFSTGDQQRDQGEPSLIAGITRQIMREFVVDPARVYIAGLSAGGAAAAVMGATYPDVYAAIGVHSGLACGAASDIPSAFTAMRQGGSPTIARSRHHNGAGRTVPTIVFHGDRDTTVNPVNGDQVIAQSRAAADLRTDISRGEAPGGIEYTRIVQTDETGRPMLEQWVLHGAGHAWSGGSAAGSYVDPRGPDASREMMRFFLQHSTASR